MRVTFLVLALAASPFLASPAQSRTKAPSSNKSETSVKQSDVRSDARNHDGQHGDAKCENNASTSSHNQTGQHDDAAACAAPAPAPAPAPPPPPAPVGLGQIHGTVYWDANKNGIKESYETGLSGWVVQITGPLSASFTTDVTGNYSFTALPVGKYLVCVTTKATWVQSQPKSGPACPTGLGYSLDVPSTMPDVYWGMIDFGYYQ